MDGIDDIGLWVPGRAGADPEHVGEWYFLMSDDLDATDRVTGTVVTLDHEFSPIPVGQDLFARFGNEFALPIVGNFDPPAADGAGSGSGPVVATLLGTSGADTFAFSPGPTPGTWILNVNGAPETIPAASIQVSFDGLQGQDAVTLTGTSGSDQAVLRPLKGTFTGPSFSVTIAGSESIAVDGRGGQDTVDLYDSAGNDTLTGKPTQTTLSGSGFQLKASNFEAVYAYASKGTDTASLYDSAGNDTFIGTPEVSRLYGTGFFLRVKYFDYVHAYSQAGGQDTARFTGSSGNDTFTGMDGVLKMKAAEYLVRAKGFDVVSTNGGGGADLAYVYDTAVRGPLQTSLIGGVAPSQYEQVLWLYKMTTIRRMNPVSKGGNLTYTAAVNKVFAAYW